MKTILGSVRWAGVVALVCLGVFQAFAQYEGKKITTVSFRGLERVSEQVVRAQVEVQPGQDYNPRAIARDIRRLYELGHFLNIRADVQPDNGGVALTYVVEEKQIISEIKILGAKKIKPRRVQGVLTLRQGSTFLPEAFESERDAILKLYASKGFANTSVDLTAEKVGPSKVRLIYSINEGRKARLTQITFVGNQNVPSKVLRKAMKTKKARWFLGGKFSDELFEEDLRRILDAYGDRGYLEATVDKTQVDFAPNGKKMALTVYVTEGAQYHVAQTDIANAVVFDKDELENVISVHPGDVHNKSQVAQDAELLTKGYQDSGYVNAKVVPQVTLDKENKTTHIVHNVSEGDLKYVRQVEITGNSVTRDDVIRRYLTITPGERYDGTAVSLSQRRLENTRYFDKVRITLHDLEDNPLFSDLLVDVEEGDTGTFNFGAGFSTDEGVIGYGELRLNNFDITNWPKFSGGGQQLRVRLSTGSRRDQYSISFTDPDFLGYPLSFGFDLYDESYTVRGGGHYSEDRTGGQIRFAKSLSPYVTIRNYYRVEESNISDLNRFINPYLRELSRDTSTASTTWQIERNTTDIPVSPSKGSIHTASIEVAGLGLDEEFIKLQHDSTWYIPLDSERRWVASIRTREGWVTPYGGTDVIPLQERFFAGGTSTVRGYDNRDIGPQIRKYVFFGDKIRIGGELRWITNFEVRYKVTDILRLYTFVDSGGVWDDAGDFSLSDMRYSAGIGLGIEVPKLGPIRIDYGVPINPDEDQGGGRLHLTTGFRF